MAKGKDVTEVTARGVMMRHLNKQTVGADSSTVIGEAFQNPAYRETAEDVYLGMAIHAVRVFSKLTAPINNVPASNLTYQAQVQTGDQSGTPAIMDLDNEFLFASGALVYTFSSGVGFQWTPNGLWPVEMEMVKAQPIIVTPELTVVHDCEANHATFQSKELHTLIEYQIVEVPDRIFTQMLMNQSRTS